MSITWSDEPGDPRALCHCWEPVFINDAIEPGFTRGLCEHCDSVRCDAFPGACGASSRQPPACTHQAGGRSGPSQDQSSG